MSTDLPAIHDDALRFMGGIVSGIGADQWSDDTPCAEWNVRELVNHVVSGNLWAAELAAGKTIEEVGDRLDGDILGDDPAAAYEASVSPASEVFRAEGAMDAPCAVSYGPVPGSIYCGHRIVDLVGHAWDLARATGQAEEIPGDLVEAAWEITEPQAELFQASGAFATGVEAGPDADPQTRLLAMLGRQA